MKKLRGEEGVSAILIIVIVLGILLIIVAANDNNNTGSSSTSSYSTSTSLTQSISSQTIYGLGDTFTFDNLQFTIGGSYSFVTLSNRYSDYNGCSVVKLPVTVKNLSSETHSLNMFYYDFFGSQGVELSSVSAYFDDEVGWAGDLRPGASYSKYFYILYDGSGTYSIDFDNFSEEVSVEFNVT